MSSSDWLDGWNPFRYYIEPFVKKQLPVHSTVMISDDIIQLLQNILARVQAPFKKSRGCWRRLLPPYRVSLVRLFISTLPTLVSFPISWWGSLPKCQRFQLSCQLCCIQTQHTDRQSLLYARLRWRERLTENDHHFPGALHFPVQLLARNFCKKKKKKSSRALNKSCKWRQSAPPI